MNRHSTGPAVPTQVQTRNVGWLPRQPRGSSQNSSTEARHPRELDQDSFIKLVHCASIEDKRAVAKATTLREYK